MINTILTVIAIICLIIWTVFSIRQDKKFNQLCEQVNALSQMNDEKALEYVKYVTQAIKNKQKVLNYSTWEISC